MMNSTTIELPAPPVHTKNKTRVQRSRDQWKTLVSEFADNNEQWQVELELGAGIVLRLRTS